MTERINTYPDPGSDQGLLQDAAAIILAGGSSERFGTPYPKQFLALHGRSVISHTLQAFQNLIPDDRIIIVAPGEWMDHCQKHYPSFRITEGGVTRQDSSRQGVLSLDGLAVKAVYLHDAARPFVSKSHLLNLYDALMQNDVEGVIPVIPSRDSILELHGSSVHAFRDRRKVRLSQTPEIFLLSTLQRLYENPGLISTHSTMELALHDEPDFRGGWIEGEERNLKITYPSDIQLAERLVTLTRVNGIDTSTINLEGKRALVLGPGGIGGAVIDILQSVGAECISLDSSQIDLSQVDDPFSVSDVSDQLFDIIIHAAGQLPLTSIEDLSGDEWDRIHRLHCKSALFTLQFALRSIPKGGHVVFLGSSSGKLGRKNCAAYSSAKAGLINLVQAAGEEFASKGIFVSCVCPSRTDTPLRRTVFPEEDSSSLLSPQEVAKHVVNLCIGQPAGEIVELKVGM